jgi:hypothetical protein
VPGGGKDVDHGPPTAGVTKINPPQLDFDQLV